MEVFGNHHEFPVFTPGSRRNSGKQKRTIVSLSVTETVKMLLISSFNLNGHPLATQGKGNHRWKRGRGVE